MEIKELEIVNTTQHLFDCFNGFMLSSDTKVFGKLLARTLLVDSVKHLPGDIVECGVFKGAGLMHWLKLLKIYAPHEKKTVFGFDTFSSFSNELEDYEKETAKSFINEAEFMGVDKENLEKLILSYGFENFELVEGEVSRTIPEFVQSMPGLRLSLVNLDFDTYRGTKTALENFFPIMSPGAILILDEYGKKGWGESDAVDEFIKEKKLRIEAVRHSNQPTAIIRISN